MSELDDKILVAVGDPESDKAPNYVAALRQAGASEEDIVVLSPEPGIDYRRIGARARGLVLAGGEDVEPARYGEETIPEARVCILPARDSMEWALLEGTRAERVPVWGVCRGLQTINVFLGGTLWQDLALQLPTQILHHLSNPWDALIHSIDVDRPADPLGSLLARETPWVNSRHHQGIKVLGEGLRSVGHAPDGLIEAVILDDEDWWMQAVQWHPENLYPMAQQRSLWHTFFEVVDRRAGRALGAERELVS